MGLRFRKTVSLGKGLRLNFSKSGVSTSVGPRGASVSFGKNGTYANVGIPGTGLSYRKRLDGGKSQSGQRTKAKRDAFQEITAYTGDRHFSYDLAMDDKGKVIVVDNNGQPIVDQNLVSLIKRDSAYGEKKSQLELQRNQALKAKESALQLEMEGLLAIHTKSPRIKSKQDYEYAIAVLRPQNCTPEAIEHFEKKKRRLVAALEGTPSFIEQKTKKWFEVCDLPFEVSASFEYSAPEGKLSVDLDLPEIELIPSVCIEQLASGKLKEKSKPKKRINAEYEQLIKSLSIYVASSLMNVSYSIKRVVLSGYTNRRGRDGSLQPEYVLSVDFERYTLSSFDYQNIEPEETIAKFENRQNVLSTGVMKAIDPL